MFCLSVRLYLVVAQATAIRYLSKNDVESVEVAEGDSGDEELAPVRVRPGISHGQELPVLHVSHTTAASARTCVPGVPSVAVHVCEACQEMMDTLLRASCH